MSLTAQPGTAARTRNLWSRDSVGRRRCRQTRDRSLWRLAFSVVLSVAALVLVSTATALADPLMETEPNDTPLQANGPFGPDGFVSTINVSDDVDFVIFRLQGERQITLTFSSVSGCSNGLTTDVSVTNPAGTEVASTGVYNHDTETSTWTTPRDATEYLARIYGTMGCETLLKISPGDALITGPLPAPSFIRTLSVSAPTQVDQDVAVSVIATGSAAEQDRVAALWTTGGCPVTPDENASGIVLGNKLATGPYTVTLATTSPQAAGTATLCTWLYDTLGVLPPLLRQQNVVVGPPPPTTPPPAPTPAPHHQSLPRVPAIVMLSATPLRTGSTRINDMLLQRVSHAYTARVTCTGAGCRRGVTGTYVPRQGLHFLFIRTGNGMHLAARATLSVRVQRPGYQTVIVTYTMRAGAQPARVTRCANPGSTSAFLC